MFSLFPPPFSLSPLLLLQTEISLSNSNTDDKFFLNKNPLIFEILDRDVFPFLKSCSQHYDLKISIEANKCCLRLCCKINWTQLIEEYPREIDFLYKCLKRAPCQFSSHIINEFIPVFFKRFQLNLIMSSLLKRILLEVILHLSAKFI